MEKSVFLVPVWISPLEKFKQSPKIWTSPLEKSIFVAPVWISPMEKSRLVSTTWISPSEKSIYARIYAHIWCIQICACVQADMDFSNGEIQVFDTSLDFSIGEIQTGATNMDFSNGEIHIWVTAWISTMEKSELVLKI